MKTNQLILTKESSKTAIRAYFEFVSSLNDQHGGEFPIDLETVWPLAYPHKRNAVRALTESEFFSENVDYQISPTSGGNLNALKSTGRQADKYHLTIPAFEWFIARRVPAVFEVYRQVFHEVRKQISNTSINALPMVPVELQHRVGSPLLIDGRMYWPYRRVLQTLGYKHPGSRFYKKAAASCMQLDLFNDDAKHDFKVEYGIWYCSEKVWERTRRKRMAWDRYISERGMC